MSTNNTPLSPAARKVIDAAVDMALCSPPVCVNDIVVVTLRAVANHNPGDNNSDEYNKGWHDAMSIVDGIANELEGEP